jgi:hypothetical protein
MNSCEGLSERRRKNNASKSPDWRGVDAMLLARSWVRGSRI